MPRAHAEIAISSAPEQASPPLAATSARLILVTICGIAVMINIDLSAVTVAMADIQSDLGLGVDGLAWVLNGYTLAFACLIAAAGRLGDLRGRRTALVAGTVIFIATSLLAGLAQEGWWLIAARVLQGGGAALMFPAMLAIVAVTFSSKQRAVAIATVIAAASISQALGPLVGGALTELVSWRLIFFVNLPIGIVVIIAAVKLVPNSRDETAPDTIDWLGVGVLSAGLVAVAVAVDQAASWGWSSIGTILLLVAGPLLVAAFVLLERRVRDPLIPPALLANRDFEAANALGFVLYFVFFPVIMYLALFFQTALGYSPLEAGLALVPLVMMSGLAAPPIARVAAHTGAVPPMTVGMVMMAAGALLLGMVASADSSYLELVGPMILLGTGVGFVVGLSSSTAIGWVDRPQAGVGSGVNFAERLLGGVLGVALFTTIFQSHSGTSGDAAADFAAGFDVPMYMLAGAGLAGAIVCWLFVRDPERASAA